MSRRIVAVEPETPFREVARALASNRVHRALVIDGETLVGIITALDIVRLVGEGTRSTD
ncbi:MAG: CBS domain-containing protein [Myxococcota bacterium]|nr:CBS domain-containing protein [Myxococcota bacterium]